MGRKIAVLGSGSWATALVKILCEGNAPVGWWVNKEETATYIRTRCCNPSYLSTVTFDPNQLDISTNLDRLLDDYQYIFLAIPSIFLKDVLQSVRKSIADKTWISAVKGIIPDVWKTVADYLKEVHAVPMRNIGLISGPCHAEEVALERLSYLTVSFEDKQKAQLLADALSCRYIKVNISTDVSGIEYAVVLKNIFAIAAGVAQGLGYGDNFQAVMMSNAIREMGAFLDAFHPLERDIKDSAYLGDLLVTGYSSFSRNKMLGIRIGRGESISYILSDMRMVAEGYHAVKGVMNWLTDRPLRLPITGAVYEILHRQAQPGPVFDRLAVMLD